MEEINNENIDSLKGELNDLLSEVDEEYQDDFLSDNEKKSKEDILSIQDITEIGADEYLVFLDYTIANIYEIMTSQIKIKKPNRETVEEIAKDTISFAISTYDIEKAKKAGAAFRTHLGWKAKQKVTEFARAYKKSLNNELNTSDDEFAASLEANTLKTDIHGNADFEVDTDMPDYHRTDKSTLEYNKKIEWAMRQVRYELPRESNLILDVGIGEFSKINGKPFTIAEWGVYTNQDARYLRKLFNGAKRLIKKKLYRKGYMDILHDQEKTSEDLLKDTKIDEQMKQQEQDENIISSTDIETILQEAEEFLQASTNVSEILKD